MTEKLFSQREVNKLFNYIPKPTLREWVIRGKVKGIISKADNRGNQREFTINNLYQLELFSYVSSLYLPRETLNEILESFINGETKTWLILYRETRRKWQYAYINNHEINAAIKEKGSIIFFNTQTIRDFVNKAIQRALQ